MIDAKYISDSDYIDRYLFAVFELQDSKPVVRRIFSTKISRFSEKNVLANGIDRANIRVSTLD